MRAVNEKLFTAVGFCFSAFMLVTALLLSVRLTAESERLSELEAEYEALCREHNILTAEYESAVSLEEIERHATQVLGMQRCQPEQIIYLPAIP